MPVTDVILYSTASNEKDVILRDGTVVTGKVDYVLTCAVGAYAYTGQAATLTVARKLSLAAGAYVYTGQAASLTVARRLSLAAGAYSYTGQAASFALERKLSLAAGAYAYAGNDATLTYVPGAAKVDYVLACSAGAYAYAGSNATLTYRAGSVVIPVEQASNWQGSKFPGSRKLTKDEERQERIRLGIIPQQEAEQIAAIAVDASINATKGKDVGKATLAAMEALEAFDALYRRELKEAYRTEYVQAAWEYETRRIRRNRAVSLLLLH